MRVGFHLQYKDNELGRAAIRLAEFVRGRGHDVGFHTAGPQAPRVDPRWDHLVETERDRPFESWVRDVQVMVATEPFGEAYFRGAAKVGAKTVLLAPWDSLQDHLRACYEMADEVVCPVRQGADLLRENWGLKNCRHVPWDNGLPATRKSDLLDAGRIKVLFPLHGWQAGSTSPEILNVVWRVLHRCPFVDATVVLGARSFNTAGFKAVKRMAKTFGPTGQFRYALDTKVRRDDLLLLYGRHDLTAWASEQEGLGTVGLDSLSMGTPVVAYDVAPQSEFLYDRKNAVLVPCELKYNWFGVPWVQPNPAEFEAHLVDLVQRPTALGELRRFTRYGMAARRDKFLAGWAQALGVP